MNQNTDLEPFSFRGPLDLSMRDAKHAPGVELVSQDLEEKEDREDSISSISSRR